MRYALCLAALLVVLSGCAKDQRLAAGFVGVSELIGEFQIAAARRYIECDRAAVTTAQEQDCYDEKQDQADQLDEALQYLRAYGMAVIALEDRPLEGTPLQQAHAVLQALLPALQAYVDPSYDEAVQWLEGK